MPISCPKCQAEMRTYERNGIHVDQCTECRGVFLDRGELEHLITAEAQWSAQQSPAPAPAPTSTPQQSYPQGGYGSQYPQGGYGKPSKKRRGFLEELFD
jgi:Zn-finger nucleic acid-binding protein